MDDSFNNYYENGTEGDNLHDEDGNEEQITAEKVLENINKAWLNERLCPEILPHCSDMIELMLGQIAHMEENLQALDTNDFRSIMHKMELERIRYILASYIRCRLKKIEEFTVNILEEEALRSDVSKRLSPSELAFAEGYREIVENHLLQVATRHMPGNMQHGDEKLRIIRPNLMSHVVIKVVSEEPATIVGINDEEVDLAPGSLHLLPYQIISDLLSKGSVSMI